MMSYWDYGFTLLAIVILSSYHIWLLWKTHHQPLSTAIGLSRRIRKIWVKQIIAENQALLAIQTLRNWTMAATLLSSTAILIALGILNVAFVTESEPELAKLIDYLGYPSENFWLLKLITLSSDFFFAFFNFILAIRYYNHVGFIITVSGHEEANIGVESVTKILQRGANHYTLGMRGYYFSIPLSLWLFGSIWLLVGSLLLIVILLRLDRFV
ncbi:DUF599 domain-containing protein [Candidatus Nitrosacidococcus tergens]|uniref:DUF599 domain-containing protein n=1 Tax=Candidatus Nitrosacidococcus tergens TaxID=553981 RepID=A0A7G1Q8V4_9GAMM|nr:DUF599 domain-containing protein [Candidatus Nitrosacidococcus tergens]CAB1275307.1 conserved membrane protein of unknown function [Candidatus Nitrosacidococcus tergens]